MTEDTIEKLKALQEILSQKFEIEREIGDLPKALSTKTELVNRLQTRCLESDETDAVKIEFMEGLRGVVGDLAGLKAS